MERILRKYMFLNDTDFGQIVKLAFLYTDNEDIEKANVKAENKHFFNMFVKKELDFMMKQRKRSSKNREEN